MSPLQHGSNLSKHLFLVENVFKMELIHFDCRRPAVFGVLSGRVEVCGGLIGKGTLYFAGYKINTTLYELLRSVSIL